MNRSRFNSPIFSSMGPKNSPDSNWQSKNAGFKESLSPDFIPFEYSSPLSSFKNSDNRNRRKFNRGSMRMHDRSFGSPQSGGSSFNSPYNSFGFNQSGDFRKNNYNQRQKQVNKPNSLAYSSNMYFNVSMLRDPWEDLEKQFNQEKEIKTVQKGANDNESENESADESTKNDEDADNSSSPDEKDVTSCSISTTTTMNTSISDD